MKRLFIFLMLMCLMDCLSIEPSIGIALASPGLLLGLIGAGLGLGGSVASGLMNSSAVSAANKANLQGVRETNEANKEMFQQALNYQSDMWQKTNEYNTPLAQRQRYEAAGLNPYLMMNSGNAGTASAMTGVSPSPLEAPHVEPVPSPYQGFTDIPSHLASFSDSALKQETAYGLSLDNKMKMVDVRNKTLEKYLSIQNQLYELRNKRTKSNYDEAQIKILEKTSKSLEIDLKYQDEFLSSRNKLQKEQANKAYEDTQRAHYEAELQRQMSDAFPQMRQAELNEISARIANLGTSSSYNRSLTKSEDYRRKHELRHNALKSYFEAKFAGRQVRGKDIENYLLQLGIPKKELESGRFKDIVQSRDEVLPGRLFDSAMTLIGDWILGRINL